MSTKLEILTEIFDIEDIQNRINYWNSFSQKKISFKDLLAVISKPTYNLDEEFRMSATTTSKLLSTILPDRPKNRVKPCTYLLRKYGYKYCAHCNQVKEVEYFSKNKSKSDGLNAYCKICHGATTAETQNARQSKYRCSKLERTPKWADFEEIKEFYDKCPLGMAVDHIIPLQGELVSGLHVIGNLQYLTSSENSSKRNKFDPNLGV